MTVLELIALLDRMPREVTVKLYDSFYGDVNVEDVLDMLDHNSTRIVRVS